MNKLRTTKQMTLTILQGRLVNLIDKDKNAILRFIPMINIGDIRY